METLNETGRMDLVHRAVALGLAVTTTAFIAASVAVVFTGNTHTVGTALFNIAVASFRAAFGG
jgi:hypothetical protein